MFACLYLPRPVNAWHVRAEGSRRRLSRESGGQAMASLAEAQSAKAGEQRAIAHAPHPALVQIAQIARDFSPRVETHGDRTVTLDISGLDSLIGSPRSIGEELRRTAADAGLCVHIAVASTSTTAILLAHARAGVTVVPRGEEASILAPLPLDLLDRPPPLLAELRRTSPLHPLHPTHPSHPN